MVRQISYTLTFLLFQSMTLFGQNMFSQNDSVRIYAYQVDTTKTDFDSSKFLFDSIQVFVQSKTNKISTINFFNNSKSKLTIDFYFKDKNLVFIKIAEQSPKLNDLFNYTEFYYDKGKLIDEAYRHNVRPCMGIPMDKTIYELYGYSQYLNSEFLKKYVIKLLDKIKLQATNGLAIAWHTN